MASLGADPATANVTGETMGLTVPAQEVSHQSIQAPEFHLFGDLPLELRQRVYTFYLLDDNNTICRDWPANIWSRDVSLPYLRWNEKPAFFPNLCLVSRSIGLEAAAFLLSVTQIEITWQDGVLVLTRALAIFHNDVLFHNIRRLSFENVQIARMYCSTNMHRSMSTDHIDPELSYIHGAMQLVSMCPRLRQLNLESPVHRRLCYCCVSEAGIQKDRARGVPISFDTFIENLDLDSVFECKELRRLEWRGDKSFLSAVPGNRDDVNTFQLIIDIADWLNAGFAKRDMQVDVQTSLVLPKEDGWPH